jgi:PmbA protein
MSSRTAGASNGREHGIEVERAAEVAIEAALAAGAEQADAWCEDSVNRTVRVYAGAVESVLEAGSRGVGVRVFVGGRRGYAYGSDLSERGLRDLAQAARGAAAVTESDEHAGIPTDASAAEVGPLVTDDVHRWTMDRRIELALTVERAARERDPLVSNVEDTVYSDSAGRVALANSAGFRGSYEASQCYAYAYAFAGEGDDLMTGVAVGVGRGPESLDPEAIGAEAADRAVALHGARQPPSGRRPVVLDPYVAASFASVIGGTLSADAVQRGRSLFAGKEGEQIADHRLRLVDDGLEPDGLATAPFDGEGNPQQRTPLIEDGTLRDFLFDAYTGRRGKHSSTGNGTRGSYRAPPSVGPTNLIVEPGDADEAELLAAADDGVYVMSVSGLHAGVNPISGTFSVGATGRMIHDGELAEPVREMTIASDLVSMLNAVGAVGAEARWVPFGGSVKVPALLITDMTIGGT